jgi:hypothetical protein
MKSFRFPSFYLLLILSFSYSYGQNDNSQKETTDSVYHDEGVVINGVKWATRNVANPGIFVATPEDMGMFYQWNSKTAREATGDTTNWDSTRPAGDKWTKANDPSPSGWRVPTIYEIGKLLDTDKVSNEWATQNGINGRRFTDKITGNSIFLPAAGRRCHIDGTLLNAGSYGYYWINAQDGIYGAYSLYFFNGYTGRYRDYRSYGYSVRSVAK